jgi:hypothetical protein
MVFDRSSTRSVVRILLEAMMYEGVSKSFRTGRLEQELQMVHFSATRCNCIGILWVSLVSCAAITLCVASQRVIPKVNVYFVIDSVRKLLDTPMYVCMYVCMYVRVILSCGVLCCYGLSDGHFPVQKVVLKGLGRPNPWYERLFSGRLLSSDRKAMEMV